MDNLIPALTTALMTPSDSLLADQRSGDLQGVGKSCLVLRYVRGQFDPSSKVTVGAAFMSHSVKLPSGATIKFEIWYVHNPLRIKIATW